MPISWWVLLALVAAAFVAGWVDAVVGGGGLIQLPAVFYGLPAEPVATVSGTNKMSSAGGTFMATINYLRRIAVHWPTVVALCGCSYLGSTGGARLNTLIPRDVFTPLLLIVLVGVGLYTWRRPALGLIDADKLHGWPKIIAAAGIGLGVGFYDGLIGPGTGTFFILLLVTVMGYGFLQASAYAKLANLTTNVAAIVVFATSRHILWLVALPMMAANMAGGFLGARLAIKYGNAFVRRVFLLVVGLLTLRVGWDTVQLSVRFLG